jgi:hypothetical protein
MMSQLNHGFIGLPTLLKRQSDLWSFTGSLPMRWILPMPPMVTVQLLLLPAP